MPKVSASRIGVGTGIITYDDGSSIDAITSASTTDGEAVESPTLRIVGNNLGFGEGVYAGANGFSAISMDFRSFVAGDGIELTGDPYTITISSKVNVTLPELSTLPGVLTVPQGGTGKINHLVNGLLVGNGSAPLQTLAVPNTANTILSWNGSNYAWAPMPDGQASATTSVASSSNSLTSTLSTDQQGNKTYTLAIVQSNLSLNNIGGILDVTKGGSGRTAFAANTIPYGNGSGSLLTTVAPTSNGQVLTWSGSAFEWKAGGSVTSVAIASASSKLTVSGGPITGSGTITLDVDPSQIALTSLSGVLSVSKGGTGLTSPGSALQVLRTNAGGTGLEFVSLVPSLISGLAPVASSGVYTDLTGRPNLATVATSGSYLDLTNRPTITSGTVTSVGVTAGSNKLTVTGSTVTVAGSFALDINEANLNVANMGGVLPSTKGGTGLSSTISNGVLIGSASNTTKFTTAPTGNGQVLTWNGSTMTWALPGSTFVLTPATTTTLGGVKIGTGLAVDEDGLLTNSITKTSQLTNDSAFVTSSSLATVATSGSYADLLNKPTPVVLTPATTTDLGVIKVGSGLAVDANGTVSISSSAGLGTVTSVDIGSSTGAITVSGGPVTGAGVITLTLVPSAINIASTTGNLSTARITGLATVATSGSYDDLTNKPTIPTQFTTAQARQSISASGSLSYNNTTGVMSYTAPVLATVAVSGSYNDLTNKPAPTVLTPATTSALGVVQIGTGILVDSSGVISVEPGVGTGSVTSVQVASSNGDLTVSGGPITGAGTITLTLNQNQINLSNTIGNVAATRITGLATVATSGSYDDLSNKPTIPTQFTTAMARQSISATGSISYNNTTGVISYTAPTLASVATSGSYLDLTNRPTIETITSANVGATGVGLYKEKVSGELRFKKLIAGNNITLTESTDAVTIASTGSGGGGNEPANSLASGSYTWSSLMNPGTTTTNGPDAASIGIVGLPEGWTASCTGGTTTIVHTVGRAPRSVVFYIGTASTTAPVFVMVPGGNTGPTGLVRMVTSGTTALNTTSFQYQLIQGMGAIANGIVHVMVTF